MSDREELGCGVYTVLVQSRCGGQYFCMLNASDISFNRVLNDISQATVKVPIKGTCCECLSDVNPWQHELAIFRNEELVWVGPIIDMEFDMVDEIATIFAKDLLTWADHRLVELADTDYEPENQDLADAYTWLLNHAYCKDPWCMTWSVTPVGIPIPDLYYPAFDKAGGERWGGQYPVVGEQMRTLSQTGVDFTVVGRHLWGGSTQIVNPVGSQVILLDNHFQSAPAVKVSGSKMGNRQIVAGGDGGRSGYFDDQISMIPSAVGPINQSNLDGVQQMFGLLESFQNVPMYQDVDTTVFPNAVDRQAGTLYDLLSQPFVYIDGGTLAPNCPLTFKDTLIPGGLVNIELATSCKDLSPEGKQLRLTQVTVSVGETESVSIDLTPQGTTVGN